MCSGLWEDMNILLWLQYLRGDEIPKKIVLLYFTGWVTEKQRKSLSPTSGIQLDIKFLCALSDVSFLLRPKGRKSAGKASSDPQGKPWMKKRACVRTWINAVEKGSTAASVHKSFKLPDSACWQGCVSTLLSATGITQAAWAAASQEIRVRCDCTCAVTFTAAALGLEQCCYHMIET